MIWKEYPYLQDSYFTNTDLEREKRTILADIQNFANQRQYIKMTLLDWEEHPLKEIEGEISSGSISKNADSPVRRTANLSCAVDARSYDYNDISMDFAINKKIFIEIGIKNETDKYPDYPIFWFPEGIFFIGSFSINSSSSSSTNISLTLKDKMAMLNGDVGGTLPAAVIFDTMDTQLPDGTYHSQKVLIYNIIKELVNHYGSEKLNNIVIDGVPLRIRRVMQWIKDEPLYMINVPNIDQLDPNREEYSDGYFTFTLDQPKNMDNVTVFYNGDDIGYIRDDFVIPGELIGNAGETVVSILDKIKNILGNYEYFYDVFGVFHFREIKNYLNTTQGEIVLAEMAEKDYLVECNNEKSLFTFSDEAILTSITVTPQYENIKNDFIVQGLMQSGNDINYDLRYHLVIDTKPRPIGVDTRPFIERTKDQSENIKIAKEDIEILSNQLAICNRENQDNIRLINRYEQDIQQVLHYVIKYGDMIKEDLRALLKDIIAPTGQPINILYSLTSNNTQTATPMYWGNRNFDNDEFWGRSDFYTQDFWTTYGIKKVDNSTDSMSKILQNYVQLGIEQDGANPLITTLTTEVYENMIPEAYWAKLIKTGTLYLLYKAQIQQKNDKDKNEWKNAETSASLGNVGYSVLLKNGNEPVIIKTPDNRILSKPATLSVPNSLVFNFSLQDLCDINSDKIWNLDIENIIYKINETDTAINNQRKKQLTGLRNGLKGYETRLNNKKSSVSTTWKNLTQPSLLPENYTFNVDGTQYNIGYFGITANKFEDSYVGYEALIAATEEKYKEYAIAVEQVTNKGATSKSIRDHQVQNIHAALAEHWQKYQYEKGRIKQYKEKIDSIKNQQNGTQITKDKALNKINIDNINPIVPENPVPSGGFRNVLTIINTDLNQPNLYPNGSPTSKKANAIEVYETLITSLNNIINCWETNSILETINNPHLNDKYYSLYGDSLILYKEPDTSVIRAGFAYNGDMPLTGNFNLIYKNGERYYYWDGTVYQPLDVKNVYKPYEYRTYDWRTKLYLDGLQATINGTDAGPYFEELRAFWPQTYNLLEGCFYGQENKEGQSGYIYDRTLTKGSYFLDFMDSVDTHFGKWSVDNIGRRSDVVVNDEINCLFQPEIPNVNILSSSHSNSDLETYSLEGAKTLTELRQESIDAHEPYTQVDNDIYKYLLTGGYKNGAFDQIKYELYLHTRYQNSVSMTTIPVFYLEPNSRVTIADATTNTFGDYVIKNISITFGPGANMSVSAVETLERF